MKMIYEDLNGCSVTVQQVSQFVSGLSLKKISMMEVTWLLNNYSIFTV